MPAPGTQQQRRTPAARLLNAKYSTALSPLFLQACIPVAGASSTERNVESNALLYGLKDPFVEEYFFNFGSSINGNRFVPPPEPLSQLNRIPDDLSCSRETYASPDVGCVCTHAVNIPFNKTIQFVLTNFEPDPSTYVYMSLHPVHLHGHNFAVVKMGFPSYNETDGLFIDANPDIVCPNRLCKAPRWNGQPPTDFNLHDPPIKDTVIVPAKGYVVLRFRSTNPGHWVMHCHTNSHHMEGMNMLFIEAAERIPQVPVNFPTCNQFSWSLENFDEYMTVSKATVQGNTTDKKNGESKQSPPKECWENDDQIDQESKGNVLKLTILS